MSRAYRIRVREALRRILRAEDHISTQLELLSILPDEQMATLLAAELLKRGFQLRDDKLTRQQQGVSIAVEPATGTVTVRAAAKTDIELTSESTGFATDQKGNAAKRVEEALRKELQSKLKQQAAASKADLQAEVTGQLESALGDLRKELDQVVNRVTAEALKLKAATIGTIKQVTEDAQGGSMTIVLEV